MKKALNAWSVDAAADFKSLFSELKDAGFDCVELNLDRPGYSAHSLSMETTAYELDKIRELSQAHGLHVASVSSSLYGSLMGSPKKEERDFAGKILLKQLECAKALGADGILAVPGGVAQQGSYARAYDAAYETLAPLTDYINSTGITVGLENVWNAFFLSPFDMARFIDRLACPQIGAYFDVGNVLAFSWPECWIEALGSRLRLVHIKDFKRNKGVNSGGSFAALLKGDADWPAITKALRAAGFTGCLTAEVAKGEYGGDALSYAEFYRAVAWDTEQIIKSGEAVL